MCVKYNINASYMKFKDLWFCYLRITETGSMNAIVWKLQQAIIMRMKVQKNTV